uniref:Uncharacterized protein n=1 Tax=Anguilla anguilla TaxID=7936 RepID=A0A0E9WQL4_ANGAN
MPFCPTTWVTMTTSKLVTFSVDKEQWGSLNGKGLVLALLSKNYLGNRFKVCFPLFLFQ